MNSIESTALVIDRSTDVQSAALVADGQLVRSIVFADSDSRSGDWVVKVHGFLEGVRPGRIVVGTGPGSFAGIRAALAFAQGWALVETACEVLGLPSPCALARAGAPLAVVGDARRGRFWVALFDGFNLVTPIFQTDCDNLAMRVPLGSPVVSPDHRRIGSVLSEMFAERYDAKDGVPTAKGLAQALLANPGLLVREPLPIYLNPAVRE